MWYIIIAVIAVIVLFLAVVLIRTLNFKPKKNVEVFENEEVFDREKAVENLQKLVRCKTVSCYERAQED